MELETEVTKLVTYIGKLRSSGTFQIARKGMRPEGPADEHVGAIIVDATLSSPRHNYERQVRKRVENLREKYPEAAVTSGFLRLIETVGLNDLLMGWEKEKDKKSKQTQVRETAQFFAREGIETFSHLSEWIRKEENRLKLKNSVSGVGDKTANYYGVLVHDPDAVAIDERISTFLNNAGIDEKKIQLQAKEDYRTGGS